MNLLNQKVLNVHSGLFGVVVGPGSGLEMDARSGKPKVLVDFGRSTEDLAVRESPVWCLLGDVIPVPE